MVLTPSTAEEPLVCSGCGAPYPAAYVWMVGSLHCDACGERLVRAVETVRELSPAAGPGVHTAA